MTPPPTTTMVAGTFSSAMPPVDEMITFSSISTSTPGMPATSEPVAMTMFFVSITCSSPLSLVTETLPWPSTLPVPWKPSILFFLNRKATPSTFDFTVASLWAIIFPRLSFGAPTSTPSASMPWPAWWKTSEACSRAFEGMQPTLRQVPP